jgi:hypothetical protein
MTIYSVVVMYFEGEQPVEVAESADLAPMLQLAELVCQHAVADVSSVGVWEAAWTGPIEVRFPGRQKAPSRSRRKSSFRQPLKSTRPST